MNGVCCYTRGNAKTPTTASEGLCGKLCLRGMEHTRHAGIPDHRSGSQQRPLGAAVRVFTIVPGGIADAVHTGDNFQQSSHLQFGDCCIRRIMPQLHCNYSYISNLLGSALNRINGSQTVGPIFVIRGPDDKAD